MKWRPHCKHTSIFISFSYLVPCFLPLSRIKLFALFLPINYERLNSVRILSRSVLEFSYSMLSDSSDYRFLPLLFWYVYITLLVSVGTPSVLGEACIPNDNLETIA
jgi:hypothetical protein